MTSKEYDVLIEILKIENKALRIALDKGEMPVDELKKAAAELSKTHLQWFTHSTEFMKELEAYRRGRLARQRKELKRLNKQVTYLLHHKKQGYKE